jgi:RHS repeat-associated protein
MGRTLDPTSDVGSSRKRGLIWAAALVALSVGLAASGASAEAAEPAKEKPKKSSSRTLKSAKATEAISRKGGVARVLDVDASRPVTLRPPLPVFSSPSGDSSKVPPVLWDQFEDEYYEAEGVVPLVEPGDSACVPLASGLVPYSFSPLAPLACEGAPVLDPGTGIGIMANPSAEGSWRSPGNGAVWNGKPGVLDFHDKYVDPDGEDGWLWFSVWEPGIGQVLNTPVEGSYTSAGGQSTWFVGNSLESGWYVWTEWAKDVSGEQQGPPFPDEWSLYVNEPPGAPTLSAPLAGATVPTPQPVLSLSGASDAEGDYLAWEYKVTSDAGCNTLVTSSGWLPMGATTWTPPLGALKDGQDYYWCARATDFVGRHYGGSEGPWSAARQVKIRLPKRGLQSYWPMFSRGPVSVNEATGNLVVSVPGPSFSSAAGSIGGGFTYNLFDNRGSVFTAATGSAWSVGVDGAPAKLIDHNLLSGDDKFDAVERVEADGTSSFYAHVAGGNTYQARVGDPSILAKTGNGFTLSDSDGSIYTFGPANGATGVAPLQQAQVSSAANGQALLDYSFDASGRPSQLIAKAKDSGGALQTLQTLTYNWSCADALVCVTGPDARTWKYIGDGAGGTSGRLMSVTNGTREILRIGYDGSGRPSSVKNANDLNPSAASPNHTTNHELQVSYDGTGKVSALTEKNVRERHLGSPTPRDLIWLFHYSAAGVSTCPQTGRTPHSPDPNAGHTGATRTIAGCTDVTLPEMKPGGGANRISVFYDQLAHPVETVDGLGNYALQHWNDRNTLEWTEDELKKPTDYAYDPFTFTLTSVTGPDPDGASNPLPRPLTKHFYDEQAPGNGTNPGTALQGLQAFYYKNPDLTGRPDAIQNDANVDFNWTGSGPAALGGQKTNIGVRWTGILTVPAQADYVLATRAEAGTRLAIDGSPLIDKWTGQAFATPECSPLINLKAGKHRITLEYHQLTTTDTRVQLLWTNGGTATCSNATTVVAPSAVAPDWQNQTSTITYGSSTTGSANRLAFSHYAQPATRQPDYTVADTTGARLISSYSYDAFGRPTQRITPKGNANRTIAGNGDLTGSAVSGYEVSYAHYAVGESASACGSGATNQLGLPKSITPHGVAPTTTTYDGLGRPIATTKNAGTTCRVYDNEGRLTSEQASGEPQATSYSYDPAGLVRTVTDASGTLTTVYNESGQVIHNTDSFGAEMEVVYNKDGNPTKRRVATGSLGTSTVYETDYSYDDNGRLTKQKFLPGQANEAARTYEFSWDARGALKATRYPNGTFSWNNYLANGALESVLNRHGTLSSPPPAGGTPPPDANALSDFAYTYFADGRRAGETRTGETLSEAMSYGYDTTGRLASVGGALTHTYCYDLNSNRTKLFTTTASGNCASGTPNTSYAYSASVLDQLTTVTPDSGSPTSYGYDPDGQATGRGADTLTWDGRGRHSGATVTAPNPTTVQFTVDGSNHGTPVNGSSPYQTTLDTSSLADGWHTLGAIATDSAGKQAHAATRVVKKDSAPVSPLVYGAATLQDTTGPSLTSASITTTAASDVVLSGYVQDQTGSNGSYAASAPTGLSLLNQQWGSDQIGTSIFEEVRATAGSGDHTATQNTGGAPSRGAATAILALQAPSGALLRRGVTGSTSYWRSEIYVTRPVGVVAGDLIVAVIGINDHAASLNVNPPSGGWTSRGLLRSSTGGGQTVAVFSKIAETTEPSSYTFTKTGGNPLVVMTASSVTVAYGVVSSDTTPPSAPGSPTVTTTTAGRASLSWSAATDASGIAYYRVHRSTTSGFTPSPANEIAQTTLTSYADSGDGSTNGLPAATYFYKLVAVDAPGNTGAASGEGSGTVTADTAQPKTLLAAPTPATLSTVSGTVTLAANATPVTSGTTVSYGFDPAGFRRSRTVNGTTTRYLLGGLIETTSTSTITAFDIDGPGGDLAHYTEAPTSAINPNYSYYSGHGDLAAEADHSGTRTRLIKLDPWGNPLTAPGTGVQELYTGRWDKKHDLATSLIEMGARPYDPILGRFLAVDPVDSGSRNSYEYASQDPINAYDLTGKRVDPRGAGDGSAPVRKVLCSGNQDYPWCAEIQGGPVFSPGTAVLGLWSRGKSLYVALKTGKLTRIMMYVTDTFQKAGRVLGDAAGVPAKVVYTAGSFVSKIPSNAVPTLGKVRRWILKE